jgi:hypothetical protein
VKKKKRETGFMKKVGKILLFILKIPYYIVKGIYELVRKTKVNINEQKIKRKRESIKPKYEEFKIIQSIGGDYKKWSEDLAGSKSRIGIILGARGTGKTAFGIKLLENIYAKHKISCFAMGFKEEELPSWIKVVQESSEIKNDSYVLVDEGGILFNSRESMSNANKLLSNLIMISRHKNISIIFISQNSSNLEINILRQADFLILKPSSLLQKEFERKIIQKIYTETEEGFAKNHDIKGLTYIYSENFKGFITNSLPSFWKESISKSFK